MTLLPPASLLGLAWTTWQTAAAAQTTIALRLWSFAAPSVWHSAWGQAELWRMVAEKQSAVVESGLAMQRAVLRKAPGADPARALEAGLRPYRTRTQANAKRLTRRL